MIVEVKVLVLAALLQAIQFFLMAVPVNMEVGTKKTAASRDPEKLGGSIQSQVSVRTGRLIRALNNHFEALILFTIAVVAIALSDQSTALTQTCAWVYLLARVLYVPAYAFDWVPWRSVIWGAGFFATLVMLIAALV